VVGGPRCRADWVVCGSPRSGGCRLGGLVGNSEGGSSAVASADDGTAGDVALSVALKDGAARLATVSWPSSCLGAAGESGGVGRGACAALTWLASFDGWYWCSMCLAAAAAATAGMTASGAATAAAVSAPVTAAVSAPA
jgi:hypothetical protein